MYSKRYKFTFKRKYWYRFLLSTDHTVNLEGLENPFFSCIFTFFHLQFQMLLILNMICMLDMYDKKYSLIRVRSWNIEKNYLSIPAFFLGSTSSVLAKLQRTLNWAWKAVRVSVQRGLGKLQNSVSTNLVKINKVIIAIIGLKQLPLE